MKIQKKSLLITMALVFAILILKPLVTLLTFGALEQDLEPAEVILIFGNKVEENGEASPRLQSRLDKGLELYEAGLAPLIIVSGGTGKEGFDESAVMKEYLVDHGVPEIAIHQDAKGVNTYWTAMNLRTQYPDLSRVIVVSQHYHVFRAEKTLKEQGLPSVQSASADIYEWRDLYSSFREVLALYYYNIKYQ